MEIDDEAALSILCAWPGLARVSGGWWLVRLFGIFVRCLGFYYDISAITMVSPGWRGPGERGEGERDTNRQIEGDGSHGQDIDFQRQEPGLDLAVAEGVS